VSNDNEPAATFTVSRNLQNPLINSPPEFTQELKDMTFFVSYQRKSGEYKFPDTFDREGGPVKLEVEGLPQQMKL
jgi:hypothetical protein